MRGKAFAATELFQLQQKRCSDHRSTSGLDQSHACFRGAACSQHIIHHKHPRSCDQHACVHLESVVAVLEFVGVRDRGGRKLAWLSHRDNADPKRERERCGKQKTPRFNRGN